MKTKTKAGRLLLVSALGVALGLGSVTEAADDQSNHAGAFLRVGVDARYLGMGGLGAAVADDVGAAYWNPAGLAMVRGLSVTGMHTEGLNFDRRHNFVAAAYGTGTIALAASWNYAGTDDLIGADAAGIPLGETFNYGEHAMGLSVAARARSVLLGVTGKLLYQDLGTDAPSGGDDTALGFGVDVGAQFFFTPYARLGFMVQNLFAKVGDDATSRSDDIPANLRFALGLEPVDGFLLSGEIEKIRDEDDVRLHVGGEYQVPLGDKKAAAVRFGTNEGELSGGFGLEMGVLQFDYAYVIEPESFLDENHRLSVTLDFGTTRDLERVGGFSDRDQDGVPDDQDGCPDEAEDYDGYGDFDGCPDLDNDEDGIPDVDDLCPDEAEDLNGVEDEDGCPDGDQAVAEEDDASASPPGSTATPTPTFPTVLIQFSSGSAELPAPESNAPLQEAVALLLAHPHLLVEIQGHTDNVGDAGFNQKLSERRAQAVRAYVISRGVDSGRVSSRGYGEMRPMDSNATEAGKARNRRIEFVVLGG